MQHEEPMEPPYLFGMHLNESGKADMGKQSQHYAGVSFDVGQALTQAERNRIWNTANNLGVWVYVEPIYMTPTWVHFDKRYGTPACSAGFPVLRSGSRGVTF